MAIDGALLCKLFVFAVMELENTDHRTRFNWPSAITAALYPLSAAFLHHRRADDMFSSTPSPVAYA